MFSPNSKKVIAIFWHHAWKYPKYVIGICILIPINVLVQNYLPPLIIASILNKLSKGDYQPGHVWASFGSELVLYTLLVFTGSLVFWRSTDRLVWKLEGGVQKDLARRVFNHLLMQSANFHANSFGGSLVSKTNKLMGAYIRFADTTIFQVMPLLAG